MQGQMTTAGSSNMMDRLMGVIQLKTPVYRAIADDTTATGQATIIVVVVTLISGFFEGLVKVDSTGAVTASLGGAIVGAIGGVIFGLIGWAFGAWVLAFVAKSFFQGKTNTMEMLRVTGYVHIFGLVSILTVLALISPALGCVTGLIAFVAAILRLIGYVIGVREAAEFSTGSAVITAIIAAIVEFIIVVVIGAAVLGVVLAAFGLAGAIGG